MTMTKTFVGVFPPGHPHAGQAHFHYETDGHAVYTGPIRGTVTVADGTQYDVTEDWIEAPLHHEGEIDHAIGVRHEEEGHPLHLGPRHPDYDPLVDEYHHTCHHRCADLKRSPEEQEAAFADRLTRLGHGHLVGTDTHTAKLAHLAELRAAVNQED